MEQSRTYGQHPYDNDSKVYIATPVVLKVLNAGDGLKANSGLVTQILHKECFQQTQIFNIGFEKQNDILFKPTW